MVGWLVVWYVCVYVWWGPGFVILECVPSVKKMFFHVKQALHTLHFRPKHLAHRLRITDFKKLVVQKSFL